MSNRFRDAAALIHGSSWLDNAARSSLAAAEAKFERIAPEPLLKVELSGAQRLGVHDTATISLAIQSATAKLGHLLREPEEERTQARKRDREAALLIPRAQVGRTMYFAFPPAPEDLGLIDIPRVSLSAAATLELCTVLPSAADDDAALDALVSQRTTVRSAVSDIVDAVSKLATGIALDLSVVGQEPVHSEVTVEQAEVLADSFRETRTDRREERLTGRLDGVRTRRRIFYLELDTGEEIHGAVGVERDLMDAIRQNLGDRVIASVVSERVESLAGRKGRPTYRLVGLERAPSLFD